MFEQASKQQGSAFCCCKFSGCSMLHLVGPPISLDGQSCVRRAHKHQRHLCQGGFATLFTWRQAKAKMVACRFSPRDFPPHRVKTVRVEPKRVSRRSKWPRRAQMNGPPLHLLSHPKNLGHNVFETFHLPHHGLQPRLCSRACHSLILPRSFYRAPAAQFCVSAKAPRPLLTLLELLLPVYKHPTPTFKWLFFHARRPDKPAII